MQGAVPGRLVDGEQAHARPARVVLDRFEAYREAPISGQVMLRPARKKSSAPPWRRDHHNPLPMMKRA
jgi:hypothetical protein